MGKLDGRITAHQQEGEIPARLGRGQRAKALPERVVEFFWVTLQGDADFIHQDHGGGPESLGDDVEETL